MFDDDEPVFKRSKWGTNDYVYNWRNPVGLALIIFSVLLVVVALILMKKQMGPFAPPEPTTSQSPVSEGPEAQRV